MAENSKEKNLEEKRKSLQRKIVEFNLLDSRIKEVEQSIMVLERQIAELQSCQISFEELKEIKKESEMLAPLGPGIFVKAKIEDTSSVLIETGSKIFSKKNIEEAKQIIQNKLDQALDVHSKLVNEINALIQDLSKLEQEIKERT